MPPTIRYLGNLIPLTCFPDILRRIMLKGVAIEYLWGDVLPLAGFGAGIIALASWRFRKCVE